MLTKRNKDFIEYYTKDKDTRGNATQSAIKAGYSKRTAYSIGQRLLKHVEVKEAIASIEEEIRRGLDMSADEIIQNLAQIAKSGTKESNKVASLKILAQIKGILKDQTSNVAIFSDLKAEQDIISRRFGTDCQVSTSKSE